MLVAPYSPSALAKASTVPARIPWRQARMRTCQKIQVLDSPSVWPDQARFSSKLSKAPRAVRYISGNATTTAAATPPGQFMTSLIPICIRKLPSGRRVPNRSSRK